MQLKVKLETVVFGIFYLVLIGVLFVPLQKLINSPTAFEEYYLPSCKFRIPLMIDKKANFESIKIKSTILKCITRKVLARVEQMICGFASPCLLFSQS